MSLWTTRREVSCFPPHPLTPPLRFVTFSPVLSFVLVFLFLTKIHWKWDDIYFTLRNPRRGADQVPLVCRGPGEPIKIFLYHNWLTKYWVNFSFVCRSLYVYPYITNLSVRLYIVCGFYNRMREKRCTGLDGSIVNCFSPSLRRWNPV